jgi:hypothetical protein
MHEMWGSHGSKHKQYYIRFEVFKAVTMKNAIFWDVAPCSSCVNWRFGGTYRLHLQGRKIRERGTGMSRWLQTQSPVENTQLYKNKKGGRVGYMGDLFPSPLYWFPMYLTLRPFLFLYSWVFSTGDSVCSLLLTPVPHSRIILPWRWRRYVPPKRQFTQELHGATSQKTAFFIQITVFWVVTSCSVVKSYSVTSHKAVIFFYSFK